MTEGMEHEQRVEFDRLLAEGSGDHDDEAATSRRAYALAYGEQE
jgi:hypothetical protein